VAEESETGTSIDAERGVPVGNGVVTAVYPGVPVAAYVIEEICVAGFSPVAIVR